jgi:hypothetical protein
MASNTPRKHQFIYDMQNATTAALNAFRDLQGLIDEYNAVGMSGVLTDDDFTQPPPAGTQRGFTKAQFVAAVGSWITVLNDFDTDNHDTNIMKVRN